MVAAAAIAVTATPAISPATTSPPWAWALGAARRIAAAAATAITFEVVVMVLFMVGSFLVGDNNNNGSSCKILSHLGFFFFS